MVTTDVEIEGQGLWVPAFAGTTKNAFTTPSHC
jgi:hypothetical protein